MNTPTNTVIYDIKALFRNIQKWGEINGIIPNGKTSAQMMKYGEEDGELFAGLGRSKDELTKDSIGDAWVVMSNVIGTHLRDTESKKQAWQVLADHYDYAVHTLEKDKRPKSGSGSYPLEFLANIDCPYKLGMLARYYSTLYLADIMGLPVSTQSVSRGDMLGGIFLVNMRLCEIKGWSFAACLEMAFEEIKNRRGYLLPNGVFVKESDMSEEEKAMYLQDNASGVEWEVYKEVRTVNEPKGVADYLKP